MTAQQLRSLFRYCFYMCCATVVLTPVIWFFSFFTGHGPVEAIDVLPENAMEEIALLPGLNADDVQSLSYFRQTGRDNSAAWYRIQLSGQSALACQEKLHTRAAVPMALADPVRLFEGFHRLAPIDAIPQDNRTPGWWNPPAVQARVTESMSWYSSGRSGVGRATCSAYEPRSSTLWIHYFIRQHRVMWTANQPPAGQQFRVVNSG